MTILWIILAIFAGALAGVMIYMVYEARRRLEVTETALTFPDLPPAFDGFRIALLSDFHSYGLRAFERQVVGRLQSIEADLLVVAGDFKARNTTPNAPVLALAAAVAGATRHFPFTPVFTRGNHDRRGFDRMLSRRREFEVLDDRCIVLQRAGERVALAGVRRTGRVTRRMRPALRKALRAAPPDGFTILVSHNPDFFRMAARRGVDLTLSGDTHGGQICLPWLGPLLGAKARLSRRLAPEFRQLSRWDRRGLFCRGLTRAFGAQLFVTRGVGTTGPPFRLLCRPEISILTLRRAVAHE